MRHLFGNFSRFYQMGRLIMGRLIPDSWFCFDSTLIPMIPVRFPWFRFDSQRNNLFDSMIPTWFHWFRLDSTDSDLIPLILFWFPWFRSDSRDSTLIPWFQAQVYVIPAVIRPSIMKACNTETSQALFKFLSFRFPYKPKNNSKKSKKKKKRKTAK